MLLQHKVFKPVWMLLGAVGVNIASITSFTKLFERVEGCNGSCGTCGFGCASSVVGVAVGGTILMIGKKVKLINKFKIMLSHIPIKKTGKLDKTK